MILGPPSYSEYLVDAEYVIAHPELFPDEVLKALKNVNQDPHADRYERMYRFKGWVIRSFSNVGIHPDAPQERKDEWLMYWKNQSGYNGIIFDY